MIFYFFPSTKVSNWSLRSSFVRSLEFESEAFFFHLVIAVGIEAIEKCLFLVGQRYGFVCLVEDAEFEHLVVEVATVELYAEDCLIEMLQLGHGELRGQEFETDGLEVYLTA